MRTWLPIAVIWPLVGVVINIPNAIRRVAAGLPVVDPGLLVPLVRWTEWLVLVPFVFHLAKRRRWYEQLAGALGISLLHSLLFVLIFPEHWRVSIERYPLDLAHDVLIYAATLLACRASIAAAEKRSREITEKLMEGRLAVARAEAARAEPALIAESLDELRAMIASDVAAAEDRIEELADELRARSHRGAPLPPLPDPPTLPPDTRQWALVIGVTTVIAALVLVNAPALVALQILAVVAAAMCGSMLVQARQSERRRLATVVLGQRLAEAELHALRRQLDPHFLFNSLGSVAALLARDPKAANEMLGRLQHFFERSRAQAAAQLVALADELEFLQSYLAVESVRFRDRLTVQIDVPPDARTCRIPSLMLQPLVENAVRHGIVRRSERGTIAVTARRRGRDLQLTVENDVDLASCRQSTGEGIGLHNTRARLAQLYGERASLEVALFDQRHRVTITLPEEPCES